MRTLSLDLSINCPGWCVSDGDKYIASGYAEQEDKRASVYSRIEKNLKLLAILVSKYEIEAVWIEDIAGSPSRATGKMLSEQQGIFKYWCRVRSIEVSSFPISSIKICMTGKGNATKKEMIEAVQVKGYPNVVQNDEADAISVWRYGINQMHIDVCN